MTKKEFIEQTTGVLNETRIAIIQKNENGIYMDIPIRKIVIINDQIQILI